MPAGSSDGSLSNATRASSPVLTSGWARRTHRPAGDGLVEERFAEAFRRKIRPVDHRRGPGKVASDGVQRARSQSPSGVGQPDKESLTINVQDKSVCCPARSPDNSPTRNGPVLLETNGIAASWSELALIDKLANCKDNAVMNSLHPGIQRLVLRHLCLPVDCVGACDLSNRWASAAPNQGVRQQSSTPAIASGSSTVPTASRIRSRTVAPRSASSRCRAGRRAFRRSSRKLCEYSAPMASINTVGAWIPTVRWMDCSDAVSACAPGRAARTARHRLPGARRLASGDLQQQPPFPGRARARVADGRRRRTNARSWSPGPAGPTRRGRRSGEPAPLPWWSDVGVHLDREVQLDLDRAGQRPHRPHILLNASKTIV